MGVGGSLRDRSARILGRPPFFGLLELIRNETDVDKKSKKRLEVINKKLQTLRPRLAGSREQADDPSELKDLEDQITKLEAEAAELKASK